MFNSKWVNKAKIRCRIEVSWLKTKEQTHGEVTYQIVVGFWADQKVKVGGAKQNSSRCRA
jgi:hypothetical protein